MTQSYPLRSLIEGSWFKLICGASYQHLPAVRSLAVAYTLAGADCIDVAADPAVIAAVRSGIEAATAIQAEDQNNKSVANSRNNAQKLFSPTATLSEINTKAEIASPLLMVSINDGEDPHFRKAKFDASYCPLDCPQPCVQICPAEAIDLDRGGILNSLCYGCGRCIPICPQELIDTHSYVSSTSEILPWIESRSIDAIEIHTQVGHYDDFQQVWNKIAPVASKLKLLAISCTDAPNVIDYLRSLYQIISPLSCPLIWQTDGRSMSGDIGKGTTHAAIAFGQKVLEARLPGYVQLAGGTNNYTVEKLKQEKMLGQENPSQRLLSRPKGFLKDTPSDNRDPYKTTEPALTIGQSNSIAGVAYGSYARAIISPILAQLETTELQNIQSNFIKSQTMNEPKFKLEQNQELLEQAVAKASKLVNQLKAKS